jgi:hemerythrin-like domain-containing protein
VSSLIAVLAEEHGAIETALDRLGQVIATGQIDAATFQHVRTLIAAHYLREEKFLVRLHAHEPGLAAKLQAQHEEALEIAARLAEALVAAETADVTYLARRLLAIAQHNIIEETRDVFPLAMRFFSAEEDEP